MKVALSLTPIFALAALVSGCTDSTSSAPTATTTSTSTPTSTVSPVRAAVGSWTNGQTPIAKSWILANISPSGAAAGAVCASPSKSNPDYYYHWTRDAGVTLLEVSRWLNATSDATEISTYKKKLTDYATFSRGIQTISSAAGIGTAKFDMDGSAYTGGWCNPQRDGAAVRALSLISFARKLKSEGADVSTYYDSKYPTSSVIKADLEYVANNWNADNSGCDIWEEVRGHHFYTRMIQRRAMIEGGQFANQMGDTGAGAWYILQASYITGNMTSFWSSSSNLILPTIQYNGGVNKPANIDSQVFLAALHAALDDGFYTVDSDRMLYTFVAAVAKFKSIYTINAAATATVSSTTVPIGVAMGRYPEDTYNGIGSGQGNPWSLITSGAADYHYRLVETWNKAGKVAVTQAVYNFLSQITSLYGITFSNAYSVGSTYSSGSATFTEILNNVFTAGDRYMARVASHTTSDGNMWEEWNRETGASQGAQQLTWSHEAHSAASRHRAAALAIVGA